MPIPLKMQMTINENICIKIVFENIAILVFRGCLKRSIDTCIFSTINNEGGVSTLEKLQNPPFQKSELKSILEIYYL